MTADEQTEPDSTDPLAMLLKRLVQIPPKTVDRKWKAARRILEKYLAEQDLFHGPEAAQVRQKFVQLLGKFLQRQSEATDT